MTTVSPSTEQAARRTPAELKQAASGKWHFIFEDLTPELAEALAAAPEHVACPHHGGTDGFRFFSHYNETGRSVCNTCGAMRSGVDTLMLAKGWDLKTALTELEQWLDKDAGEVRDIVRPAPPPPRPKVDPAVAYRRIREVWTASLPIAGTPAQHYLQNRGIWLNNIPSTLRAHPGLPYVHGKERSFFGRFPCLLAPVRNVRRELVTLHRIFVSEDGQKAPVPDPKKMMSQCRELSGAAIQLFEAEGDTLGVAEGIETALAAHAISQMPVWSTISAVLMEQLEVPPHIKRVVIWADRDTSERGIQAASVLAERLEKKGIHVEVYLPPVMLSDGVKGVDWLDVLLTIGVNGFPPKWRRWRPAPSVCATS